MCDELGPNEEYLMQYIEEAGGTSLCGTDGTNCDERSLKYLEKFKDKDSAEWKMQLERLEGLEGSSMVQDLKSWVKKRKSILKKLLAEQEAKTEL
jgi:hypothetical protein